jgi:hypothetical protein
VIGCDALFSALGGLADGVRRRASHGDNCRRRGAPSVTGSLSCRLAYPLCINPMTYEKERPARNGLHSPWRLGAARVTDIDLSLSATYSFNNRAPGWLARGAPMICPRGRTIADPAFHLQLGSLLSDRVPTPPPPRNSRHGPHRPDARVAGGGAELRQRQPAQVPGEHGRLPDPRRGRGGRGRPAAVRVAPSRHRCGRRRDCPRAAARDRPPLPRDSDPQALFLGSPERSATVSP